MKLKELMDKYGECEVIGTRDAKCRCNDESYEGLDIYIKKPTPRTVWDLQEGDIYYYLSEDGKIGDFRCGGRTQYVEHARSQGNVFLTQKEAEKERERREVETLLLKYGGRRWHKKDGDNCYLWVTEEGHGLVLENTSNRIQGTIYFDTEEQLKKAFSEIGEDRIKRALFEVR